MLDLHVVEMTGWKRGNGSTLPGLPWVDPSPNIRSLNEALLYPGLALLENFNELFGGRGTDAPFEQIGADWIRGRDLVKWLNARAIPGVQIFPQRFRPASSNFSGKTIEGIRFVVTNRDIFSPSQLGLDLAAGLAALYPGKIVWEKNRNLIGNSGVMHALASGADAGPAGRAGIGEFLKVRERYLIYP